MIPLAVTTAAYAGVVALACLVCALRSRPRPAVLQLALVVVGLGATGTAGAAAYRLVTGPRPAEFGTHLGYLATAPLLLPLVAAVVRGDPGRWGSATFTVGCLAVAVVLLRLIITAS